MSTDHNFRRPSDIDEPAQFFFWEFPQVLIGTSLICTGIIMGSFIGMIVFAWLGCWYLLYSKRQMHSAKRGEFLHHLWAIGIRSDKLIDRFPFGIKNFSGRK